jgi:hypothetical protein
MFIDACGRVDFPGGNAEQMYYSLTQKLMALPEETILFPGHNYAALAHATIGEQKKMPVVMGQLMVAPCFRASVFRNPSIVVSLPRGTRRISSSTSRGAGMTNVPSPQRLLFVESIGYTCGKPLSSASFSRQLFFFALMDCS